MEHFGGLNIDGGIIFKVVLKKQGVMAWAFSTGSIYGPVMGFCEHSPT
jgi:hypothetical protein